MSVFFNPTKAFIIYLLKRCDLMPYGKEDIQCLNIIYSLKSILERFEISKSKGELKENLKDLIDIYDL
jgi:hypothetical protein